MQMDLIYFTPPPSRGPFGRYGRLFKGGSAPAAPDPVATANAQADANIKAANETANLSRTNEVSPFGNTTWSKDPNNTWTSTFTLDPKIQGLLDQVYTNANSPAKPVDTGALPGVGSAQSYRSANPAADMSGQITQAQGVTSSAASNAQLGQHNMADLLKTAMPTADETMRQKVADAYYKQETSRLDPQYQQMESEMRSRLANQGITEGSEAYNRELDSFNRGRTDAYSTATNSSITNSTDQMLKQLQGQLAARGQTMSEAQGAMGMYTGANSNLTGTLTADSQLKDAASNRAVTQQNADASARANALNEQLQLHNLDVSDKTNLINQLMALRTGAQVQGAGAGQIQVAAAPVAQSIYNTYQGKLQESQNSSNSTNSMLGTGGALIGAGMQSGVLQSF
jgi:hypothetical protein